MALVSPATLVGPASVILAAWQVELTWISLLTDGDLGIFVSSGDFTSKADNFAHTDGSRTMLIDLRHLFDLSAELYAQIDVLYRGLLPLRPVYFVAPDD